jgi:DMSO/TMAO reductase YedYZ molybdopterin-dependent catalytic subunit
MSTVDPLQPHAHDPNPDPPGADPAFKVRVGRQEQQTYTPAELRRLPRTSVRDVFIVSTGHGSSGPFTFTGVALRDFVRHVIGPETKWRQVEVVSGDGFGTRIGAEEVQPEMVERPILLSDEIDGRPLARTEGLVRLVVPSEHDDALRQVKWVGEIRILL